MKYNIVYILMFTHILPLYSMQELQRQVRQLFYMLEKLNNNFPAAQQPVTPPLLPPRETKQLLQPPLVPTKIIQPEVKQATKPVIISQPEITQMKILQPLLAVEQLQPIAAPKPIKIRPATPIESLEPLLPLPRPTKVMRQVLFDKPSPYTCSAYMKSDNTLIIRNNNQELECVASGFKPLVFLDFATDEDVKKIALRLEAKYPNIKFYYYHAPEGDLFIYTDTESSKRNGLLMQQAYEENFFNDETRTNDYLFGTLLGFDDKDIEFYYEKNNLIHEFQQDKIAAEKFINDHVEQTQPKPKILVQPTPTKVIQPKVKPATKPEPTFVITPGQREQEKEVDFPFEAPSQFTCGAALKAGNITIRTTLEQQIQCLFEGHKKVLYGDQHVLDILHRVKQKYPQSMVEIGHIVFDNNKSVLLYTPEGKRAAEIFATLQPPLKFNAYLIGKLLGYEEPDIQYYYLRNDMPNFEQQKADADAYLRIHLPELAS